MSETVNRVTSGLAFMSHEITHICLKQDRRSVEDFIGVLNFSTGVSSASRDKYVLYLLFNILK
jgi:hypothetical protein